MRVPYFLSGYGASSGTRIARPSMITIWATGPLHSAFDISLSPAKGTVFNFHLDSPRFCRPIDEAVNGYECPCAFQFIDPQRDAGACDAERATAVGCWQFYYSQ